MNRLTLTIDSRWQTKDWIYTPLETMQRVTTSLKWRYLIPDVHILVPRLKCLACNIRTLEFSHTWLDDDRFVQLLNQTTNLKDLKVRYSTIFVRSSLVSSLSSLESLTVDGTANLQFLDLIANNTSIRSIEVTSLFNQISSSALTKFTKFLATQRKLKSFSEHQCGALFESLANTDFSFKLERLVIDERILLYRMDAMIDRIKKFIAKHRTTLEHLEMSGNWYSVFLPFVMQELRVKVLKFYADAAWIIHCLQVEEMPTNHYLKKLELRGALRSFDTTARIFQIYPSIEYFKVENWYHYDINSFMRLIGSGLKKLVILDIPTLSASAAGVSMPSLKMVKLGGVCYNLEDWKSLLVKTRKQQVRASFRPSR